jgi:hypothetical protein
MVDDAESELLGMVRKEVDGAQLKLMTHREFIEQLPSQLRKIAKRRLHQALIIAVKHDYKSSPRKAD